jgi:2-phosphosulfolactate phosphatase
MRIQTAGLLRGAEQARGLAIIIDVFRAFTTACYALSAAPRDYLAVADTRAAARIAACSERPFLIGKPELGASLTYDIPNSPTRLLASTLTGSTAIHRTGAGARGILHATEAEEVIAASLVNAGAAARYAAARDPDVVTLVCMGHEGTAPSAEDEVCAELIEARLRGRSFDLKARLPSLREGPGRYFFGDEQLEYPREDFDRCTEVDRFTFILRAARLGDHARLTRVDV